MAPVSTLTRYLAAVVMLLAWDHPTHAAPYAYVSNYGSFGDISVIDTATNAVITTVGLPVCTGLAAAAGDLTFGVAVNALGTRVYLTDNNTPGRVYVFDPTVNLVVDVIRVGNRPVGIAVHPNMGRLYVANKDSDSVSVVDTSSNTQVKVIPVGREPAGVAAHPAGTFAYVTNSADGTMSAIDTATDAVVATVPVGMMPWGIAASPDGTRVYVANTTSGSLSVVDTLGNAIVATVAVGSAPLAVAVNPASTRVYVSNYPADTVTVVDTATNAVSATVPTPVPQGLTVHPSGTSVYVANACPAGGCGGNSTVSVIDTGTHAVVATIPVERSPIAFGQFIAPGCQLGTCDDGNPCTDDTCDPEAGCSHSEVPSCPTTTTTTSTLPVCPPAPDADSDGEPDATDLCPGSPAEPVDRDGCTLAQFCTPVDATTPDGARACKRADWRNDEPLMRSAERNCTIDRGVRGRGDDRCIPAVAP